MTLSELIKELQALEKENPDAEVFAQVEVFGQLFNLYVDGVSKDKDNNIIIEAMD